MSKAILQWLGNRSPSLTDTITVDGDAFNLTGATVKFRMRLESSSTLKVDANASVVGDATNGNVRYDWQAADVDTAGEYVGWWRVTLPGGNVQETDEFAIVVRAHAPGSANLCSLADVREGLELPAIDRNRDDLIETLIPAASRAISTLCGREFAPAVDDTLRRLEVHGRVVDLAPWNLRAADTVTLHPESSAVTLAASTDYTLQPTRKPDGVYDRMILAPDRSLASEHWRRFGFALLDVTGDWGYATVPADVRQAAVTTISSWLRRDVTSLALADLEAFEQARPLETGQFSIPAAALRLLSPYRRHGFA